MVLIWTVAGDFEDVADNTEAVTVTDREGSTSSVTYACPVQNMD